MTQAIPTKTNANESGTPDAEQTRIVGEEERTLNRIQKHLVARAEEMRLNAANDYQIDYDAELISLRNQIQEARLEDVPPLIEEMERLTEVAARRGKVAEGAIDSASPYFGRLVLEEDGKKREVLIGKATYLDSRTNVRIVDWRDAPVSRIYYRYEEGDEYEERFGGRDVHGEVAVRRAVAIGSGLLRRIGCPQGIFVRGFDGSWRRAGDSARLKGGQGSAMRAEDHHSPGKLGVRIDDGREEKYLPEITALIDPRQFELITKPDGGLVVIQGGAGSGKTTIGLHRLAYLAFQDAKRFRADRMLVLVYNDALVRYISRVLPSLGAGGVPVTTFERWAEKLRGTHLRGLPTAYHDETPTAVTRLKKHQTMLDVVEGYCTEVAAKVEAVLVEATRGIEGADDAVAYWRAQHRAPVALRLHRLDKWASPEEDPDAELNALARGKTAPVKVTPKPIALRHAIERTLSTARREHLDVTAAWAEILTDLERLTKAFANDAADLDAEDLASAHRWCVDKCGLVLAELEQKRDEGGLKVKKSDKGGDDEEDTRKGEDDPSLRFVDGEQPAKKLVVRRKGSDDDDQDDDDDDRSVGVDGAEEQESAKLDREDDALLLRITQRLRGPLLRGSGKQAETLRYEHILIDEAQDLSPVELAVVMGTTTKQRSVTMAGDVSQRLHMDNGFKSWKQLLEAVDPRKSEGEGAPIEVSPLKVQYRSTHEIIELAQEVLGPLADPESGNAIRPGAPVELFQFAHSGEAVAYLGEALRELMQAEPRASVCLVARYPEQADLYYKGLVNAEVPHLRRIADQDFPFRAGIDVTDVRQVKGLEFDYVVLLECTRAVYPVTDECRHLLHIAVTRAAHQLWVTATGEASLILPESLRNRAF
ncbi:MAG: ATP-binding domain-containing protein [Deltaproteobacteria bacterium]|nr:ATP-binding domain-containing protein [Deltaproteobacteria bacterium]